ncbi:MAG: helix-turn-helix transcriptional regulator [Chloroflexota bacterium]|nr:helix-turn-helix transcriptional regulator [Chloroflexota bacterium]
MGVQKRVYRPVEYDFPADFPERLELFLKESGLSARGLARLMGVRPDRVRKWRNRGVAPGHAHLFLLLTIADAMELRRGILMQPDRDLPEGVGPEDLLPGGTADPQRQEQT